MPRMFWEGSICTGVYWDQTGPATVQVLSHIQLKRFSFSHGGYQLTRSTLKSDTVMSSGGNMLLN